MTTSRREQIFATALALFARYGFKKTTVEDIAGELGLTKGALYLYVKNKQDLFEKTIAWALADWQQQVRDAVMPIDDVRLRFRAVAEKAFEFLLANEQLQTVISAEPALYQDLIEKEPFRSIHADSMMMIENIIAEGIASGAFRPVDAASTASMLFSLYLSFIAKTIFRDQQHSLLQQYRNMLDLFCLGLFIEPLPASDKESA